MKRTKKSLNKSYVLQENNGKLIEGKLTEVRERGQNSKKGNRISGEVNKSKVK